MFLSALLVLMALVVFLALVGLLFAHKLINENEEKSRFKRKLGMWK